MSSDGVDHCPECGNPFEEKSVFGPNEGPNKSQKTVAVFIHEGYEMCSRVVAPDTDGQEVDRDV